MSSRESARARARDAAGAPGPESRIASRREAETLETGVWGVLGMSATGMAVGGLIVVREALVLGESVLGAGGQLARSGSRGLGALLGASTSAGLRLVRP